MIKLSDEDKLLLLFYLAKKGLPVWADGSFEKVAARLFDWDEKRAGEALATCHLNGWIDHT